MAKAKMERKTAEWIMLAKGAHPYGDNLPFRPLINAFGADHYGWTQEDFRTKRVEKFADDLLYEAALNYLDCCDRPSAFVRDIRRAFENRHLAHLVEPSRPEPTKALVIMDAFVNVQVRDNDGFVNGFDEELIKPIERHNNE